MAFLMKNWWWILLLLAAAALILWYTNRNRQKQNGEAQNGEALTDSPDGVTQIQKMTATYAASAI